MVSFIETCLVKDDMDTVWKLLKSPAFQCGHSFILRMGLEDLVKLQHDKVQGVQINLVFLYLLNLYFNSLKHFLFPGVHVSD